MSFDESFEEEAIQYCLKCTLKDTESPTLHQLPGQLWWEVPPKEGETEPTLWIGCVTCYKSFHARCYFRDIQFMPSDLNEYLRRLKKYFRCPMCNNKYSHKYPGVKGRW